jgi:hypothetical protein
LVLAAGYCCLVYFSDAEYIALGLNAIHDLECRSVYQVEQLLFSANEEVVIDNKGIPHVLDIECLDLFRVSSAEDVDFVLTVDCDDKVIVDLVDVSSSLAVILAVDDWSR